MNLPAKDDFTEDQWDAFCWARRHNDPSLWYRLLRALCGYTFGKHRLRREMNVLVDAWLRDHPSWTGRYLTREEVLHVLEER